MRTRRRCSSAKPLVEPRHVFLDVDVRLDGGDRRTELASSFWSNAAAAASNSASGTPVSETRVAVSAQARTAAFPVIEQRTATARTAYERLINEQFVVGMGAAGAHVADSMAQHLWRCRACLRYLAFWQMGDAEAVPDDMRERNTTSYRGR